MGGPDLGGLAACGDQQRLTHQRVQKIQHGIVIDAFGSHNGASTLKVKSACEHRTAFQHCLFSVIEQVVRPRHRLTQRMVALQSAP
jgi:hypothetical protein